MSERVSIYKNCKVLYVDDEDLSLKYFERAFEDDFTTLIAQNAQKAMEILDKEEGDVALIISDQRMPGTEGSELLAQVRKRYPKILRIMMTAYVEWDAAKKAINDGFVFNLINKPWDEDKLREIIKNALGFHYAIQERDALFLEKRMNAAMVRCRECAHWQADSVEDQEKFGEASGSCMNEKFLADQVEHDGIGFFVAGSSTPVIKTGRDFGCVHGLTKE